MGLFSDWLKKEQGIEDPVGLEAAKRRVLGENQIPQSNPEPNPIQPQEDAGSIQNNDDSARLDDINARQRAALIAKREELSKLTQEGADFDEAKFGNLRGAVRGLLEQKLGDGKMSPEDQRQRWLHLVALAHTAPSKARRGNAQQLTHRDASTLIDPLVQESLRQSFGTGTREEVKNLVQSRLGQEIPMDVIKQIFKTLPTDSQFRKLMNSGKQTKNIQLWDPDLKQAYPYRSNRENFQGFDNDGNELRGGGGQPRQLLLLKRFLEQGGRDGYTGFDLDPRFMELEHIVGTGEMIRQEDGTMRPPTLQEYRQREHPDNWTWTSTGINSFKGENSLLETLDKLNGMKERIEEGEEKWGVDLDQGILDEQESQQGIASLIDGMFDENGNFTDDATPESIKKLFDNELKEFQELNPRSTTVPVKLAKAIAKKLKMARSFQQNGSYYMDEQLLRPIIMNILNSENKMERRGDYQVQWLRSRADAKRLFDLGRDAANDEELGSQVQLNSNGDFNLGGTWGNLLYPRLYESGLLTREDLENEDYFPSEANRNRLRRSYPFFWDMNESYKHEEDDNQIYGGIDFRTFLG